MTVSVSIPEKLAVIVIGKDGRTSEPNVSDSSLSWTILLKSESIAVGLLSPCPVAMKKKSRSPTITRILSVSFFFSPM